MNTSNMLLCDIAERKNLEAQVDVPLKELIRMMHLNGKGVMAVLEGEKPVGILTERDVVRLLFAGVDMREKADPHARKPLIAANGVRSAGYAFNLMVENNIRRLIVVDSSNLFLGVVTHKDLLKHMEEDYYRSDLKVTHIYDRLKKLISVPPGASIAEVLQKMVSNNISAVPILKNGVPVGMITEKDILRLANTFLSLQDRVAKHMSSPVMCANLDTSLVDVVRVMNVKNISRVVIREADGTALGIITSRDLVRSLEGDYSKFLEMRLRQTKDFLNLLPEMLLELIDTGPDQLVVWANEKVFSRFGREIIDKPVTELVPSKRWDEIYSLLVRQKRIDEVRFKKGKSVFECSGFYIPQEKVSEKGRVQLILRDITEEVVLATSDPLTGIYNRRVIGEFLAKETERSIRTNKRFAVVLAGLDSIKKVHDANGHGSRDVVLKAVAEAMVSGSREYDLVGRYGDEQFLLILPEIGNKSTAVDIAERIRRGIETREVEVVPGENVTVTASFGVACFEEDGKSPDDLLVKVDERLNKAKREGGNRVISG